MTADRSDQALQALVAAIDYPMFVVTTAAGGDRSGCLVGFATQCSISPARFFVCISQQNHTLRLAARAEALAVHFLAGDDLELARLFGEETGDDVDKFAWCRWEPGPGDLPILCDCRGWVAGTILQRLELGDHVGFVIEPFAAEVGDVTKPQLAFQQVRHLDPGHRP